jgi:hypothetical protein
MTQDTPPLMVIPGGRDRLERQLIDLMFRPEAIQGADMDVERLTAQLETRAPTLQVVTTRPQDT